MADMQDKQTRTYFDTRVWVGSELVVHLHTETIPEFRDNICIIEGKLPGCENRRIMLKGSVEKFAIVVEEHSHIDDDLPF